MSSKTIWTIGHSSHELEHFLEMLAQSSIMALADVRRFPGSRRQAQFNREHLEQSLSAVGIEYRHMPRLGGRRTWRMPNSPNTAWRVEAFNAYADHTQTDEFRAGLDELQQLAALQRTAMMCAEAVPWRCHRRIISDALVAQGWTVLDIYAPGRTKEHCWSEFAKIENGQIVYPALF